MFSQLHMPPPVSQGISVPPASVVRHVKLGELVPKESWDDCMKRRGEVHKQDPDVGSCGILVLEDEVKGQIHSIVYRPAVSVGELQSRRGSVMVFR